MHTYINMLSHFKYKDVSIRIGKSNVGFCYHLPDSILVRIKKQFENEPLFMKYIMLIIYRSLLLVRKDGDCGDFITHRCEALIKHLATMRRSLLMQIQIKWNVRKDVYLVVLPCSIGDVIFDITDRATGTTVNDKMEISGTATKKLVILDLTSFVIGCHSF